MSIWPRLTTIVPLLLTLAVSAESSAQMMGHPSYGAPTFMGGPQQAYPAGPGMAPSFQSHPMISPYDHAMEQHFSSDGMWFKDTLNGMSAMNSYYFSLSYMKTRTRDLQGRFGDLNAPSYTVEETLDGTNGNLPDALTLNNFNPATGNLPANVIGHGMLMTGGMENRQGWGFDWNFSWNANSTGKYDARKNYESYRLSSINAMLLEATTGQGVFPGALEGFNERSIVENEILTTGDITSALALDFGTFGAADDVLDRQLFNLHAIPLQNGVDRDGFNQRFDLDFILEHAVETYGGGADFVSAAIHEGDNLKISTVFGGQYMRINEGMYFRGVDSGLIYDQNLPDGRDDDNDGVYDNVAETGSTNFAEGNPYGNVANGGHSLIRSYIDSSVQSTMGGPEVGLKYVVGEKDGFSIKGATKVGAMFNHERVQLEGDNIGDTVTTSVDLVSGNTLLQDMYDTTITSATPRTQNAFSSSKSSTHVSPMFQQSLTAELPIFSRIPVLRDVSQLQHASFQAGWNFTWIGEVADPNQSISWLTNPRANLFPGIDVKRRSFYQNSINLGINWEY
ncbi:MAG: hypothetical protein WAO83_21440 [Fuerstiella sp.]